MKEQVKRALRITVGICLLILGVVGLALPVLQGWLTIFAGLYVLFPEDSRTGGKLREWVRGRKRALAAELKARRPRKPPPA